MIFSVRYELMGAAATRMSRVELTSSGVTVGLLARKPSSGGTTCRKFGWNILRIDIFTIKYRVEQKKNLAKFSDTCSVRADGLCIGSPRLVGGKKAGNLNMQEFFCTTL